MIEKAWQLNLFDGSAVINDMAGILDLVLIGDIATRTVRAYYREGLDFTKAAGAGQIMQGGDAWQVTEDALIGPGGRSLGRLPGRIADAFAWEGYFCKHGELAAPK